MVFMKCTIIAKPISAATPNYGTTLLEGSYLTEQYLRTYEYDSSESPTAPSVLRPQ